jgi:hypothetical protein
MPRIQLNFFNAAITGHAGKRFSSEGIKPHMRRDGLSAESKSPGQ